VLWHVTNMLLSAAEALGCQTELSVWVAGGLHIVFLSSDISVTTVDLKYGGMLMPQQTTNKLGGRLMP